MFEAVLVTWGLTSEPGAGDARSSGPTFSLAYEGRSDCPSRANFEAAIARRAPTARATEDPEQAEVRFEVELTPVSGRKRRLSVKLRDGTSQDREIDADDCAEAVQSMAVIAAMILSSREAPLPAEQAATETKPEPQQPRNEPKAPPPAKDGLPKAVTAQPPPERHSRRTWLAVGAGPGLEGAAAPSPTFAASAFVELGSLVRSQLAPSLRLSALVGQALDATSRAGDARFRLVLGRLHGCGVRFDTTKADLRLCAVVEGGALLARGINTLHGRDQTMGWFGAGLGAIGGLRLGPRWTLELGAGARGLVVHDEFVFSPSVSIHQVPVIAWNLGLALAYRLW